VTFAASDELLAVVDYQPTAAGAHITGLSVNALTTLAAVLAAGYFDNGLEMDEAVAWAHRLFGRHLERTDDPEGIDIRATVPSDFSDAPSNDRWDSVLMGLFHIGLSRWGADAATSQGLANNALPTMKVLQLLKRDLEDNRFDGRDRLNQRIYATPNHTVYLTTNTLRWELANAIANWLDNVPLDDGTAGQNATAFTSDNFSLVGGFFDALATDTSELFGDEPPVAFDRYGPTLEVQSPVGHPLVSGTIQVRASATDPSGVLLITVEMLTGPASVLGPDLLGGLVGHVLMDLNTGLLLDGPNALRITAVDTNGNTTTQEVPFVVDNTPPALVADAPGLVNTTAVRVEGTVSDLVGPVVTLRFSVNGVVQTIINTPAHDFAQDLTIQCNRESTVSVQATDAAAHDSVASLVVACDDASPGMTLLESTYIPASRLAVTYADGGNSVSYVGNSADRVNLATLDWGAAPTLEKYFNRLDNGAANLPIIKFSVGDTTGASGGGTVFTPASQIQVAYRYTQGGVELRPWTLLSPAADYQILISYQSLQPSMAIVGPTVVHAIEVRLVDLAGNTRIIPHRFKLKLFSPPVWYGDCQVDTALSAYSLAGNNLHQLYTQNGTTTVSTGTLRYLLGLPAGSLAPRNALAATVGSTVVGSRIVEVRDQKYDVGYWTTICCGNPQITCPGNNHQWATGGLFGTTCSTGWYADDTVFWSSAQGGSINDSVQHVSALRLFTPSGEVTPDASLGTYALFSEEAYTTRASVTNPRLSFSGAPYDWDTVPLSSRPERDRYRLHYLDRTGRDTRDNPANPAYSREYLAFWTRPYIKALQVSSEVLPLSFQHPTVPATVGIQRASSCSSPVVYSTNE
jgi:hypothetical protein